MGESHERGSLRSGVNEISILAPRCLAARGCLAHRDTPGLSLLHLNMPCRAVDNGHKERLNGTLRPCVLDAEQFHIIKQVQIAISPWLRQCTRSTRITFQTDDHPCQKLQSEIPYGNVSRRLCYWTTRSFRPFCAVLSAIDRVHSKRGNGFGPPSPLFVLRGLPEESESGSRTC